MIVGVPKEIKNNENRVGMTPAGVYELIKNNHTVFVQKDAGFASGFFDQDYNDVGATVLTLMSFFANSTPIPLVRPSIPNLVIL